MVLLIRPKCLAVVIAAYPAGLQYRLILPLSMVPLLERITQTMGDKLITLEHSYLWRESKCFNLKEGAHVLCVGLPSLPHYLSNITLQEFTRCLVSWHGILHKIVPNKYTGVRTKTRRLNWPAQSVTHWRLCASCLQRLGLCRFKILMSKIMMCIVSEWIW